MLYFILFVSRFVSEILTQKKEKLNSVNAKAGCETLFENKNKLQPMADE